MDFIEELAAKIVQDYPKTCVEIALRVMENVNAHEELALVKPQLKRFSETVIDFDPIATASQKISYSPITSCALLCAILDLIRAPETGEVWARLSAITS